MNCPLGVSRFLTFGLTVGSSALQWLQSNIANFWIYVQLCVTCFVYIALVVPMIPLQLCVNSLPEKYKCSINPLCSLHSAPLTSLSDSLNTFISGLSICFSYFIQTLLKSIKNLIISALMRCLYIFDRLAPWLFLTLPFTLHLLSKWSEPLALIYYISSFIMFCFVIPDRHLLCPSIFSPPPKRMTSREFAILSKRLRKERSKRRKQINDMLSAMELDPYRDPKARRRKFKRLAAKYTPQGGVTGKVLGLIKNEAYDILSSNQDLILREIEDLVLLYFRIKDCKTWKGVMANIVSDVKKRFPASISMIVLQCIDDLFKDNPTDEFSPYIDIPGFTPPSTKYKQQAGETSDEASWLRTLRTASSNWKLATNNEGFNKLSRLMSLLIGAGLLQMSSINVDVGGLQLFSELSVPKHVSAFDLIDATFSSVVYFVEGGYECICTGDLKPLLYGEHEMRKFDEDFLKCSHYADFARPGNLALLSIDENDLDALFTETLDLGKRLSKTSKSPMIRKHLQDRLVRLQDMQSKFTQFRQTGNIREKPYCIGIYGGSSVGKSTIGPLLMTSCLYYNNFNAADEATIVLNEHDKYMSNYKSSINGVFLDDVGNTVADFVETAPTVRILELVNNVKMYANMAEADLKGKVSIQPRVVVCTTNTKDFCAHTYSNEPVSIARRANYIVTATVRPEFSTNNMLDESKVFAHFGENIPQIPDLWFFHVERAYPIPNKSTNARATIGWNTLVWNDRIMKDIDIGTLIQFTNMDSKHHFENQGKIVQNNSNLAQKLTFCESCRTQVSLCTCGIPSHSVSYIDSPYVPSRVPQIPKPIRPKNKSPLDRKAMDKLMEEHLLKQDLGDNYTPNAGVFRRDDWSLSSWRNYISDRTTLTTALVYSRLDTFASSRLMSCLTFLPDSFFSNRWVHILLAWFFHRVPAYVCVAHALFPILLAILFFLLVPWSAVACVSLTLLCCASCMYTWRVEAGILVNSMSHASTGTWCVTVEKRRKIAYILGGCALLAGIYTLVKGIRSKRSMFTPQGMMHPTSFEIDERDKRDITNTIAQEQNWAGVYVKPVPVSQKSKTTTYADLKNHAINNSAFMEYTVGSKTYACDAFFVFSNVAIIPKHAWKSHNMLCTFTRHDPNLVGGNFRSFISRSHAIDIPGMDATMIWVPNGGSWKDVRDYFPQEYPTSKTPAEFLWKDPDGAVHRSPTLFSPQKVNNGAMKFFGGKYNLKFDTKVGLCMAPLVAETKSPYFVGFHLGGVESTPKACAGTILRKEIDQAAALLEKLPGVLLAASAGTMQTELYGVQFLEKTEMHAKSPARKLPIKEGITPNIELFGSCTGRVTYYSDVVPSCISNIVSDVCGVANKWGKPKFHLGQAFQASLEHSSHPSHGFEGDLLAKAAEDYAKPFTKLLGEHTKLRNDTRPLTRMETVCGIDGKKFVDKMPPNTSIGYPLSGAKRNFLTYPDPDLYEGFNCPAELDEIFWTEFEVAKACYLRGERYYPTFKACLKDEPTLMSKDKVRVFQAAPVVLQLMIRMYFLPIARIFSLFPAISECAVGVNCMGPDWSELGEYMRHFGDDRILAGDYSKYDLRMPAQVMFAAFRVMIDVAEFCGYASDDLKIMRGIATDVCYPVMAYNGDLIQHIGSNPSGQNLTVYINSIVNSLLFRCAYYNLKGLGTKENFRDICKLMTYGDDVKGSVKRGYDTFNHLYVAKFFAEHDMVFTMPDKESTPTPFMKDSTADFLKRKNTFCGKTGYVMGALDEDSIFKSLHANLNSTAVTREQLAADNIDGALREWFNHGEEMYEKRRLQMQEVAKRAKIDHICTQLDKTYDEQVEHWKERYFPDDDSSNIPSEEEDHYEVQAGVIETISTVRDLLVEASEVARRPDYVRPSDGVYNDQFVRAMNRRLGTSFAHIYFAGQSLLHSTFNNWAIRKSAVRSIIILLYLMAQQEYTSRRMGAISPQTAAAADSFCGDEFIPYAASMYDHCNGADQGFFSWKRIIFNISMVPVMAWIGSKVVRREIRYTPFELRYYHFICFFIVYCNLDMWACFILILNEIFSIVFFGYMLNPAICYEDLYYLIEEWAYERHPSARNHSGKR